MAKIIVGKNIKNHPPPIKKIGWGVDFYIFLAKPIFQKFDIIG